MAGLLSCAWERVFVMWSGSDHLTKGTSRFILSAGQLVRSVHFPEKIDPASVKAEYKNGLLRVTAPIAKATTTKVAVRAA